jgi:hypothetical protein
VRRLIVVAAGLATGVAVAAPLSTAAPAVVTCGVHHGFVVYVQGVTCPTAKRNITKLEALAYKAPKVTIRSLPGWVCAASYKKATKKLVAGSCLKVGTQATGFGFTKGGAQVPLPPGVDPGVGTGG